MSRCKIIAACLTLLFGCNSGANTSDLVEDPVGPSPPVVVDPPVDPDPDPDPEPPIVIDPVACYFEIEPNGSLGVGPVISAFPGFFQSFCGTLTAIPNQNWDVDNLTFFFPDNTFSNGLILSITAIGEADSGIEIFVTQWDFSPPFPEPPYSHVITHAMPNGNGITITSNVQVPFHHNGFSVGIRNLASVQTQYQLSIGVVGVIP